MPESVILDASALLAVLFNEQGSDHVLNAIPSAIMSTVNETEVLTKAYDRSGVCEEARIHVDSFNVEMIPFTQKQSRIAAELQTQTKSCGLSLADRACLALAIDKGFPVLTGDRIWSKLKLGIDIRMIR